MSGKYNSVLKQYNEKFFRLVNLKVRIDSLFWLILQCALITGYYFIISDAASNRIDLGSLSFFLAIAANLQETVKNFGSSFNGIIQSGKYFDNLLQFEEQNAGTADSLNYIGIPEIIESIEFRNVSFSYPNSDNYVIKNVSFTLRYPKSVILVGENGAGKTTLLKLLMGFYKPTSGEILLNGINIRHFRPEDYFRLFSVASRTI